MRRDVIFLFFIVLCCSQSYEAKDSTKIEWKNVGEFSETTSESSEITKGACNTNSDCGKYGKCKVENGVGICKCSKGIIGEKCEIIEGCEKNKNKCGSEECAYHFKKKKAYCRCKTRGERFDEKTKTCVVQKTCDNKEQCKNEGYCAEQDEDEEEDEIPIKDNLKYCQCPLGTSGDFCEIVPGCEKSLDYCGDGKDVECRFNPNIDRVYCQCLNPNQRFDLKLKKCVDRRECRDNNECSPYGVCFNKCQTFEPCISHQDEENKRSCHCIEGTSGHNCEIVEDCFNKVVDCGTDDNVTCGYYYNQGISAFTFCKCKDDSLQFDNKDKVCKVCDCGTMGKSCRFLNGKKMCTCKDGSYNTGDSCEECDCGPSSDCKINENGKKICSCKPGFTAGDYGVCTPMCSDKNKCANGGLCLQNICVCLAGTGGPFCEKVYDCDDKLCGKKEDVLCDYDTKKQRAFCQCRNLDKVFDPVDKECKSCQCGLTSYGASLGSCQIRLGKKICQCVDRYSFNPLSEKCEVCNCISGNCSFDTTGQKICVCPDGFVSYDGSCRECDCGIYGICRYIKPKGEVPIKVCTCDEGYQDYKGKCIKCQCSPNGKCSGIVGSKSSKCICDKGYQESSGTCKLCDCGPDSIRCYFKSTKKVCECSRGFKEDNGYCQDIDECLETKICSGPGTECLNTVGSFKCRCQPGYFARNTSAADILSLCQKEEEEKPDNKPWKIGYGVLSAAFIAIIIALVVVIVKIRRN